MYESEISIHTHQAATKNQVELFTNFYKQTIKERVSKDDWYSLRNEAVTICVF